MAARLALAGDVFSLADAVEGAWLSGEARMCSHVFTIFQAKVWKDGARMNMLYTYYIFILIYIYICEHNMNELTWSRCALF